MKGFALLKSPAWPGTLWRFMSAKERGRIPEGNGYQVTWTTRHFAYEGQ